MAKKVIQKKAKKIVKKRKAAAEESAAPHPYGLTPKQVKNIRNAIRQQWHRSWQRKAVVTRCTDFDGFPRCECCYKRVPKVYIDHINNVGDVDAGFIERMFVGPDKLQGLCKEKHDAKTKEERARAKELAKQKERDTPPQHIYFNCAGKAVVPEHIRSRCIQVPLVEEKKKRKRKAA